MPNPKYTVVRDTKEQIGWDFPLSDSCAGVVDFKLETGDYSLLGYERIVSIERKRNVAEIATNINEPRFPKFIDRLSKFKYKFIVCEFSLQDILAWPNGAGLSRDVINQIKVTPRYIMMRLSEYMVKDDIKVVFAGSRGDAVKLVSSLFKRIVEAESV